MTTITPPAPDDTHAVRAGSRAADSTALVPDAVAAWLICFAAIQPFSGSQLLWGATVCLLVLIVAMRRHRLASPPLSLTLVAFMTWLGLSTFWSVRPDKTITETAIQLLLVAAGVLISIGRTWLQTLTLFATTGAAFLALNLAVSVAVPSIGQAAQGPYVNAYRGLFVDKNLFAFFAVIVFGAGLVLLLDAVRSRQVRALDVARPLLAIATVVIANSATALVLSVVTVVLALVLTWLGRARRPLLVPVAGTLLLAGSAAWLVFTNWSLLLVSLGRSPTLTGRTRIWYAVELAIRERPVLGYGWKALWIDGDPTTITIWAHNYRVPFYHAHNGYLDIAAQLGIVGLVLAVGFVGQVAAAGSRTMLAAGTSASTWPVLVVLVVALYNSTEVVGLTTAVWVVLVALSCQLSPVRKEDACTSPTPGTS